MGILDEQQARAVRDANAFRKRRRRVFHEDRDAIRLAKVMFDLGEAGVRMDDISERKRLLKLPRKTRMEMEIYLMIHTHLGARDILRMSRDQVEWWFLTTRYLFERKPVRRHARATGCASCVRA